MEIGCGNGELLNQLKNNGAIVTGLEIGPQAKIVEERYGIRMLTEPLTVGALDEKFDCIFSYGCLEHIEKIDNFFEASRTYLENDGLFFHSVPNSGLSFSKIHFYHLLHEHINYFTTDNAIPLFNKQGFSRANSKVTESGNELMIWGYYDPEVKVRWPIERFQSEFFMLQEYAQKLEIIVQNVKSVLRRYLAQGFTLGFYAGGYEYGYELSEKGIRYFDSDEFKYGKKWLNHLPAIEAPDSLIERPVDKLIICKPHYAEAIKINLRKKGFRESDMLSIDHLAAE